MGALTAARPNLQDRACQGWRDRPLCPRSTLRETATDALLSPTACGRTGLRPLVCYQFCWFNCRKLSLTQHDITYYFCLCTGSTPTPFPCNPLIMRFPSGTVSAPSPSASQPGVQAPGMGAGQGRSWEEEPKPLLMSQYETLSDSEWSDSVQPQEPLTVNRLTHTATEVVSPRNHHSILHFLHQPGLHTWENPDYLEHCCSVYVFALMHSLQDYFKGHILLSFFFFLT